MTEIEYRTLGASGLRVSPICLGTMTFGEPVAEAEAIRLVHGAMDLGINFVDTAHNYGKAEEAIGKALGRRRNQVFLATKVWADDAATAQQSFEESLRALRTDLKFLELAHRIDRDTSGCVLLAKRRRGLPWVCLGSDSASCRSWATIDA